MLLQPNAVARVLPLHLYSLQTSPVHVYDPPPPPPRGGEGVPPDARRPPCRVRGMSLMNQAWR